MALGPGAGAATPAPPAGKIVEQASPSADETHQAGPTPDQSAPRARLDKREPARPVLRQTESDDGPEHHWARWTLIGAGIAAAGGAAAAVLIDGNHQPTAGTIDVSPPGGGMAGATTFTFTAVDATDPDGDALSYRWGMGDGSRAEGERATHAYASPGTYTVSLEVSDGKLPVVAPATVLTVERNLSGTWSGGHALPMLNPLRLELVHDTAGLSGTLVAEPYRGTLGGNGPIEGRVEGGSYPCRVSWSAVLLNVVTVRFEGSVADAEGGLMTGTITVEQPGEFSGTRQTTFRR
jgi:hypothetical protein